VPASGSPSCALSNRYVVESMKMPSTFSPLRRNVMVSVTGPLSNSVAKPYLMWPGVSASLSETSDIEANVRPDPAYRADQGG
jgi:hypothetical protein